MRCAEYTGGSKRWRIRLSPPPFETKFYFHSHHRPLPTKQGQGLDTPRPIFTFTKAYFHFVIKYNQIVDIKWIFFQINEIDKFEIGRLQQTYYLQSYVNSSRSRNLSEGGGPMTRETCGAWRRPSFFD